MQISFENEYGKITMGGGSHPLWNMTKVTGLGLPSKSYNTVTYTNQDGQHTLSETSNARAITIGGDITNNGNLQNEISKAIKIFNAPGDLKIRADNRSRMIKCRCTTFDLDERNGAAQIFVLQFICDKPYFSDLTATTTSIYKREDMITGIFTLPMAFTVRTNEADIMNSGDVKVEPVITLYDTTTLPAEEVPSVIDIYNATIDKHIKLNYSTAAGEVITINLPKRKITSSIKGNIINSITTDTFLSEFWMAKGINHISMQSAKSIHADLEFSNMYIEAVY